MNYGRPENKARTAQLEREKMDQEQKERSRKLTPGTFAHHPEKGRCLIIMRFENGVYRFAHDYGRHTSNARPEDLTPRPDWDGWEEAKAERVRGVILQRPVPEKVNDAEWLWSATAYPGVEWRKGDPDPDAAIEVRDAIVMSSAMAVRPDRDQLKGWARKLGWEGE